ncbi:hypothetical protein [Wolbachia endosymbiont of Encarsia formosa]|uniref:hypothetical protein n=1 Tax=Wolbachia endosymbiont of Encarsia formosa TaxID=77125 RepID=UPI0031BA3D84
MPNKSEINQELVRAFNGILRYNEAIATNLVVEKYSKKDCIVISFDENMDKMQCMKYLNELKGSILDVFYNGDKDTQHKLAKLSFDMNSFPFKGDKKFLEKDQRKYKFSIPIDEKVFFNLKCLLANEFAKNAKMVLIEKLGKECIAEHGGFEEIEVNEFAKNAKIDLIEKLGRKYIAEHGGFEEIEVEDKKTYLYAIDFDPDDTTLQDSFKDLLLSKIGEYRESPEEALEIKGDEIYIKSNVFNEIEFIKSIVRNLSVIDFRALEVSNDDDPLSVDRKFSLIDLFCKAGTSVNATMRVPCSDKRRHDYLSKGEKSILIPVFKYSNDYVILLKREEVDHLNKIFGMNVLSNMEDYIDESFLSKLEISGEGIYAIDCANPDIAYCVMNKVIVSSVINEDYKLSIDPARVPAMKPQTLAPSEEKVGTDGPSADTSADSGFGDSPKNSVIGKSHNGNLRKFFGPDYSVEGKGGDDASTKDSGFCASSAQSSFDNKPKPMLDKPSASQHDQRSAKKLKSICCIL